MSRVKVEFDLPKPTLVFGKNLKAGHCYRIVQDNGMELHSDTLFVDKYVIATKSGDYIAKVVDGEPTWPVVAFSLSGHPILEDDKRMFVEVDATLHVQGEVK